MKSSRLPLVLCLFSGIIGINYEVLFFRIITTHFGDLTSVQTGISASFLSGLVIGYYFSNSRFSKIWLIEILIGALGFLVYYSSSLLPFLFDSSNQSWHAFCLFFSFLLVLFPAILIGATIPSYEKLIKTEKPHQGFLLSYGLYNLTAAFSVLFTEFYIIRSFGIYSSLMLFSFFNILLGLLLYLTQKNAQKASLLATQNNKATFAFFTTGLASGFLQLSFLKAQYEIMSHSREVFPLLLFSILISIPIGCILSRWLSFYKSILISGIGIFISFLFLDQYIKVYDELAPLQSNLKLIYQVFFACLLSLLPFIGLSTLLSLGKKNLAITSSSLLASNTLGMVIGLVSFNLYIYENFSLNFIIFLILLLLFVSWQLLDLKKTSLKYASMFSVFFTLPFIDFEYRMYSHNIPPIEKGDIQLKVKKKNNRYAGMFIKKNGPSTEKRLFYEGHTNILVEKNKLPNPEDHLSGLLTHVFSKKRDRIAILGIGTGVTASSAISMFKQADAIDISPVMKSVLSFFENENYKLESKENIKFFFDDARNFLAGKSHIYDSILHTASSLRYDASSKLATEEFYSIVKKALTKKGVFHLNLVGRNRPYVQSILSALKPNFNYCFATYAGPSFFHLSCSDYILRPQKLDESVIPPLVKESILRNFTKTQVSINRLLSFLFLSNDFFQEFPDSPRSTDDFPLAEFYFNYKPYADPVLWDWLRQNPQFLFLNHFTNKKRKPSEIGSFCQDLVEKNFSGIDNHINWICKLNNL